MGEAMKFPNLKITSHTIGRFMERAGVKDRNRAMKQIAALVKVSSRNPDGTFHAKGWTLVITKDNTVETIYRLGNVANKSTMKKRVFSKN